MTDKSPTPSVRATIAVERIARLLPRKLVLRDSGPAMTATELAETLETLHDEISALISRASAATTERDHYREVVEGGRAFLGLVVPELVYSRRVVLGSPDPPDLADWTPGPLTTLPPDPLTVLQQEVAQLAAAVARLVAASEPANAAKPLAERDCRGPGCSLVGGHPGQHHPWRPDQAAYDAACRAHHPGELCDPGANHPGANN